MYQWMACITYQQGDALDPTHDYGWHLLGQSELPERCGLVTLC